jgi:SAM-dependent methyltransferase
VETDLTGFASALLAVERDPERVLEIECGDGAATLFLAREFPRARVRGVDSDRDAIRAATARIGLDPEGRVAFKVGAPGNLPFPEEHFDLVVQRRGRLSAAEIARVLRPEGFALVPVGARSRGPLGLPVSVTRTFRRNGLEAPPTGNGEFLLIRRPEPGQGARRE